MLSHMNRDDAIAELRRVKRLRERADAAQKAATEATEPAVAAALNAGLRPVEIVKECGVSDSYVRGVRRANKIPANPSYANLKPPTRTKAPAAEDAAPTSHEPEPWAEPSVLTSPLPKYAPVPDDILRLPIGHLTKLASSVEKRQGAAWVASVLDRYPGEAATFRPYRIVEHAWNQELVSERDLFPQEP